MALDIESCSLTELCVSLGGSEKLLTELRERLQDWLNLQPHLPQDIPKEILEHFILSTKMSLEQSKRKIDMFYTMRRLAPELFTGRDPRGKNFARMHTMEQIVFLPKLTPEKYRVCIFRPTADDYSEFNPADNFKYTMMLDEMLMRGDKTHSLGHVYILDHSNITLGLMAKFTPALLKKVEVAFSEAYAQRITAFHHINAASITDTFLGLIKRVVKPKLASRLHVYGKGNLESLYEHVPKSILPSEYGGSERSMAVLSELWKKRLDDQRDWFLAQEKIFVDERLRPGPAVNGDDLFGFSGSFRKLDLD